MTLAGKTVLITGGAAGLGLATAQKLLAAGSQVHVIARSAEHLTTAEKEVNNPNFHTHQADVAAADQLEKVVADIGAIDILLNCAGVWLQGLVTENSPEEIQRTIATNFTGVVLATRAVLPGMLARNDGYIINVSSTSGLKPRENQAVYAASKYAVSGFTQCLQTDLMKTNIKIAGFYPGGMATGLFANGGHPVENSDWMDPNKVAEVLLFMLERDDTMIIDHLVVNKRGAKKSH